MSYFGGSRGRGGAVGGGRNRQGRQPRGFRMQQAALQRGGGVLGGGGVNGRLPPRGRGSGLDGVVGAGGRGGGGSGDESVDVGDDARGGLSHRLSVVRFADEPEVIGVAAGHGVQQSDEANGGESGDDHGGDEDEITAEPEPATDPPAMAPAARAGAAPRGRAQPPRRGAFRGARQRVPGHVRGRDYHDERPVSVPDPGAQGGAAQGRQIRVQQDLIDKRVADNPDQSLCKRVSL